MPDHLIHPGLNILSIHTASRACDVCVLSGETITRKTELMTKGQDAALPSIVQHALSEAHLALNDLDRVSVVTGPGSFTGLRIGLAFSRGLGLTLSIPVIGVNSLEASAPFPSTAPVRVALAAKRRPPDRSWWVDTVMDGHSSEAGPAELEADALRDLQARDPMSLVSDELEGLQALLPATPIKLITTSAVTAGLIARGSDPSDRPPDAAYVRGPDADLPKSKA